MSRWQASAKPSPSVALDPVDGGSATSARRCSRGSLRFCGYARTLVSAARPKESSFLQRRTKFSERRSERPDVTEASSSRPPALRTGGKGVWSHTTDSSYAFRFKDFTFNAQTVFTGWVIITGETTVDATGNANAGTATIQVYDPNGNLIATACAGVSGTRFEL